MDVDVPFFFLTFSLRDRVAIGDTRRKSVCPPVGGEAGGVIADSFFFLLSFPVSLDNRIGVLWAGVPRTSFFTVKKIVLPSLLFPPVCHVLGRPLERGGEVSVS